MSDDPVSAALAARAAREMRKWNSRDARKMREFDKRKALADGRWKRRRRKQVDRATVDALPKTKPPKVSGQTTAVARGAESLLTPVEHFMLVGDSIVYMGGTSTLHRIGPGRAATTLSGIGEDERRAELVWAAAVLYFDLLAVYRALRVAAPSRQRADELIAQWPNIDQRPVVAEMLARGGSYEALRDAVCSLPMSCPPAELLPVLSLMSRIGSGAHLMDAELATLDLDKEERAAIAGHGRSVRELPDRLRRRLFQRRDQQVHVRRIPALPQQRGVRSDDRSGTSFVNILFAGHSRSRRFSHVPDAPRRELDVASDEQLDTLYRLGPRKAALAAAGRMLDRSAGVIGDLVRKAKVLGLVVPENTRQAE